MNSSNNNWYNDQITKIKTRYYARCFSEISSLIKELLKKGYSHKQIAKDIFESDDEVFANIILIIGERKKC